MTEKNQHETKSPSEKRSLVGAEALLRELFPDEESRPTLRWVRGMQAKRMLPFRRLGRRIFFDPEECRRAIDEQFKVESIG